MTIVEQITAAKEAAEAERDRGAGPASREFALAITHLEDAAMRVNRAFAIRQGIEGSADVEAGRSASQRR